MKTIKQGDKGYNVSVIQRMLHVYPDGIFGPITEEAVRAFQSTHGLDVDGMVGDKTWQMLLGTCNLANRRIDEIIIHCSDTKEGQHVTVDDITRWHKERGFSTIGYHYVIYLDGSIHPGRDIKVAGAHCEGHNAHSIGICYIGGRNKQNKFADTRTDSQKEALHDLITTLRKYYPDAIVVGHNQYSSKSCPCFDVEKDYSHEGR